MQKRRGGLWTESGIPKGGNNVWDVWPWCSLLAYSNYRTAQEKSVRSAKPKKQTSAGLTGDSFLRLYTASQSFPSTGFLLTIPFLPTCKWVRHDSTVRKSNHELWVQLFATELCLCPGQCGYTLRGSEWNKAVTKTCLQFFMKRSVGVSLPVQQAAGAETQDASSKALWKCLFSLGGWRIWFSENSTLFIIGEKKNKKPPSHQPTSFNNYWKIAML